MTFTDESNEQHTTLAVVGEKNVHILEGRALGFSKNTTPSGRAAAWLRDAILEKLAPAEAPKKGKK